jgi:hypothetical protein
MLEATEPFALVKFPIRPLIFSEPLRFSIYVVPLKSASIMELFIAFAIFIV